MLFINLNRVLIFAGILFCTIMAETRTIAASPQDQAKMLQLARQEARLQLIQNIFGVKVSTSVTVSDLCDSDTQSSEDFRRVLLQGVSYGPADYSHDGFCYIDAVLTMDQVIENLHAVETKLNGSTKIIDQDITRFNKKTVIRAIGMGVLPDPKRPLNSDVMPDDTGLKEAMDKLSGTPQEKYLAKKSAELDARLQLVERLNGVKVSQSHSFYNMVEASGVNIADIQETLIRGAKPIRYIAEDQSRLRCDMQLTLNQLIENIKRETKLVNGIGSSVEDILRYNKVVIVNAPGYGFTSGSQSNSPKIKEITGEVK